MSFGQHQYQHRFFRPEPHKKLVGQTPIDSRVLPLPTYSYHQEGQYYTPQPLRHPVENPLNLKVRAGEIAYNEPGWQGYRLKSYVTEKYGQNYNNYRHDQQTIERFRREAQEHKRKLRFGSRYGYEQANQQFLPEIRIKTEPPQIQSRYFPRQEPRMVEQNPEIPEMPQINRFDVGIMARVQSRQKEKHHTSMDHQQQERRERRKLREYRKKYSKLKTRLKEELNLQRNQPKIKHQQNGYDEKDRRNMSRIEKLMSQVSDRIVKNTIIFNEGIRVEKQLREMREQAQSQTPIQEQKVTSVKKVEAQPVQAYYNAIANQQQYSKPATPKVVYTHKRLNESYEQLQRLKSEISSLNQRIDKKYKQL